MLFCAILVPFQTPLLLLLLPLSGCLQTLWTISSCSPRRHYYYCCCCYVKHHVNCHVKCCCCCCCLGNCYGYCCCCRAGCRRRCCCVCLYVFCCVDVDLAVRVLRASVLMMEWAFSMLSAPVLKRLKVTSLTSLSGCNIGSKTLLPEQSKLPLKLTCPADTSTCPATLLNKGEIPKILLAERDNLGSCSACPIGVFLKMNLLAICNRASG